MEALEEQYKKTTRGSVEDLVERSTQTRMKLGSAAGQAVLDTSPSALYYAVGLGVSCSKGCLNAGRVDLSHMTALKSCRRPLSCP